MIIQDLYLSLYRNEENKERGNMDKYQCQTIGLIKNSLKHLGLLHTKKQFDLGNDTVLGIYKVRLKAHKKKLQNSCTLNTK